MGIKNAPESKTIVFSKYAEVDDIKHELVFQISMNKDQVFIGSV